MPSSAPAPAASRRPARLPSRASGRALLVAAGLGAAALGGLSGTGVALAAPAPVEPAPLVLRDASGTVAYAGDARAYPSFATATLVDGCPSTADDAARLSVSAGGATVVTSPTVPVTAGQPVTVPMATSFEEVVADGVEQGGATLTLECLVVASGIPSEVVPAATLPVSFSAGTWSVPGAPAVDPTPPTEDPTTAPTTAPTEAPTDAPTDPAVVPVPAPTDGAGSGVGTPSPSATARPAASGDLAFTGGQIAGVGALAAGLLAGGTALVLRRRRGAPARD